MFYPWCIDDEGAPTFETSLRIQEILYSQQTRERERERERETWRGRESKRVKVPIQWGRQARIAPIPLNGFSFAIAFWVPTSTNGKLANVCCTTPLHLSGSTQPSVFPLGFIASSSSLHLNFQWKIPLTEKNTIEQLIVTIWIQKLLILTIDSTDFKKSIINVRVLTIQNSYDSSAILDPIDD